MTDYSKLTDLEINERVSLFLGVHSKITKFQDVLALATGKEYLINTRQLNPCSNWCDAGPIIESYKISLRVYPGLSSRLGEWEAFCIIHDIRVRDKNPLRAAMICFLMMKDAENE